MNALDDQSADEDARNHGQCNRVVCFHGDRSDRFSLAPHWWVICDTVLFTANCRLKYDILVGVEIILSTVARMERSAMRDGVALRHESRISP
jgi:hypothetical protein